MSPGGGLPGVTQVLRAAGLCATFDRVDPGVLEAAQARGSALHAWVEGWAYGYEVEVPPAVQPYVDAFVKFVTDSRFTSIAAEVVVEHPVYQYQGHPDLIGWLNGQRVLLDLKTGEASHGAWQVAGYVEAWNASTKEQVVGGALLHLRGDGTYRFEEIEQATASQVWFAALTMFRVQAGMR